MNAFVLKENKERVKVIRNRTNSSEILHQTGIIPRFKVSIWSRYTIVLLCSVTGLGHFWNFFAEIFHPKVAQTFVQCLGLLWKRHHLLSKNCGGYFLAILERIGLLFHSNIWSNYYSGNLFRVLLKSFVCTIKLYMEKPGVLLQPSRFIHLCLPSCSLKFRSQAHHLCFSECNH